MIHCDLGHEHESLDAAVACVRGQGDKPTPASGAGGAQPRSEAREGAPTGVPIDMTRRRPGRPRVHADVRATRRAASRAYRERKARAA